MKNPHRQTHFQAVSLVEVLIVIAVLGVISAIAIPTVSRVRDSGRKAAALNNAQNIASMSQALDAIGVAHVIPESLGGVEATARLLREGVVVPEGVFAGEKFGLPALRDSEIEDVAQYLQIQYGAKELRLIYLPPSDQNTLVPRADFATMYCRAEIVAGRVLPLVMAVFGRL